MQANQFREDLYHRLNVCHLQAPPLRDRTSDIPLLAYCFLERLNRREGQAKEMTADAVAVLAAYSFPGNVRELENILESAYHLCADDRIRADDVSPRLIGPLSPAHDRGLSRADRILDDLASGRADFWTAVLNSKSFWIQNAAQRRE